MIDLFFVFFNSFNLPSSPGGDMYRDLDLQILTTTAKKQKTTTSTLTKESEPNRKTKTFDFNYFLFVDRKKNFRCLKSFRIEIMINQSSKSEL